MARKERNGYVLLILHLVATKLWLSPSSLKKIHSQNMLKFQVVLEDRFFFFFFKDISKVRMPRIAWSGHRWFPLWLQSLPGSGMAGRPWNAWMFPLSSPHASRHKLLSAWMENGLNHRLRCRKKGHAKPFSNSKVLYSWTWAVVKPWCLDVCTVQRGLSKISICF